MHTPNKGYRVRQYSGPVKRFCQIMNISDNPLLMAKYRQCHSRDGHWPEIVDGIRQVSILEMELYIHGNTVVMIVETEPYFEWDSAMARLATLPRQAEWEAYVAAMQECDPNATSDQKWSLMERMFYLYD